MQKVLWWRKRRKKLKSAAVDGYFTDSWLKSLYHNRYDSFRQLGINGQSACERFCRSMLDRHKSGPGNHECSIDFPAIVIIRSADCFVHNEQTRCKMRCKISCCCL